MRLGHKKSSCPYRKSESHDEIVFSAMSGIADGKPYGFWIVEQILIQVEIAIIFQSIALDFTNQNQCSQSMVKLWLQFLMSACDFPRARKTPVVTVALIFSTLVLEMKPLQDGRDYQGL
ncbi:uncharacterized protein PHALS_01389 [Plasmopara halstedii]|uniref:Uncharacterized protein n=1 Tax=Plasmopara halstedii TaxID=4781 RepID=A0A0P1AWL5_PLAHL|nr:uncharacterized protein PHALS_01389 [Plasmopara halstedii]CEG45062.1 hypothetical protein PHALS_01389 [Plasmopara halstedii]|eukprot:XP_024581431.1 hypothetical protein PHALS_01389 [Plasmopara halstedii]